MKARYLVRFDDLCPTMNWDVWHEIEAILVDTDVKPILAVVPDNRDDTLRWSEPNSSFWEHVRRWQKRGWTIGLHGYQHRYVTRDPGIIGLDPRSEFAGLAARDQEMKLRAALETFRREGVAPSVWVAPAHSFDENTVMILKKMGITTINDGFFFFPHVDRNGIMWVPQQLWRFRSMPFGVWTVCFHHNVWTENDVSRLRRELHRYREFIANLREVMEAYKERRPRWIDAFIARSLGASIRMKKRL